MVPHYNYFPPSGQVIDATDGRVAWNGRAWMLNGKVYGVPSTHHLIGRPGGPLAGWTYDWSKHAWMEPSPSVPPAAPPATRSPMAFRPGLARGPQTAAPQPSPQPQPPAKPEKKEETVEKKPNNILEAITKHPVAPVIGGVLLLASHFTDEPVPPQISADIPETTAKQWMMIYNQNQQRFQRRMELYENLGMVLMGYASTQTMLDALPSKK